MHYAGGATYGLPVNTNIVAQRQVAGRFLKVCFGQKKVFFPYNFYRERDLVLTPGLRSKMARDRAKSIKIR